MSSIESLRSLASEIAAGFDVLLERIETQKKVEAELLRTIEQLRRNASTDPSEDTLSDWQGEIVKQICSSPEKPKLAQVDVDPAVQRAKAAVQELRKPETKPVSSPRLTSPKKCPIAHGAISLDVMEKDFTTQGKPSDLSCPFAKNAAGANNLVDPIAAEFHADTMSARSIEESRACGRCPIRFLDKHSPEELAEYFEKHKHELPRSHEICVKRYQGDEQSARQLDQKYGNMINMIQGLGNKHKAYLPQNQQQQQDQSSSRQVDPTDTESNVAVRKWAHKVEVQGPDPSLSTPEPEARQSHFEKPMRAVRVGESPSRPWGISVPVDVEKAASAVSSEQYQKEEPVRHQPDIEKAVVSNVEKGSLRHTSKIASTSADARSSRRSATGSKRNRGVVFNGPVFFGYSPDQASQLLEKLQLM